MSIGRYAVLPGDQNEITSIRGAAGSLLGARRFFAVKNLPFADIPAGGLLLVYACIVNKKPANKQKGRRLSICVTFISV